MAARSPARPRASRIVDARRTAQTTISRENGAEGEYEYQMVFFDDQHRRHVVRMRAWSVRQLREQIAKMPEDL